MRIPHFDAIGEAKTAVLNVPSHNGPRGMKSLRFSRLRIGELLAFLVEEKRAMLMKVEEVPRHLP